MIWLLFFTAQSEPLVKHYAGEFASLEQCRAVAELTKRMLDTKRETYLWVCEPGRKP